jgi:hypothetical protein
MTAEAEKGHAEAGEGTEGSMNGSTTRDSNDTGSEPYVNGLQEWVGESEAAGRVLTGWHLVSLTVVATGLLRYGLLVGAAGVVSLLLSTHVHYWRDELAPEMRHSRGEGD